ncbi:uncharacterized protein MKK02DRAFT_37662 [Dioszegia hungarica]|uniref:Uncharacterized protein n=1 Tax=Dioszegia hungarica TaxID=4972 RepID=A0AA38LV30_9TREE|nr:uncharacterized protein MKK02DRAFT_37662 [Dioszegia hungarica]KAI9634786.1 hypothetical protein MKK02DRAFT_37662 [Dioszegia hungarica]
MFLESCCIADVRDPSLGRPLSLSERFGYITIIARQAHAITYLYRYSRADLPTIESLSPSVDRAQRDIHHLWAEVVDGETPQPAFRLRPQGPWAALELVRDDTYAEEEDGVGGRISVESRLLESEIRRMQGRAGKGGPAWQITRYLPTFTARGHEAHALTKGGSSGPVDNTAAFSYLAVSFFHHIIDGSAGLALSLSLLSGTSLVPAHGLAPRLEDLVRLTPSVPYLIKEAYHELLIPTLPAFMRRKLEGARCWPGEDVKGNPAIFPEAQETFHLPSAWIAAVKRVGKAHGVHTVHPIVEAAFVSALREVTGTSMLIDACTPVNDRDAANPATPRTAGVMFSALNKVYAPSLFAASSTATISNAPAFWAMARDTAQHHLSPSARKQGRYHIGVLGLVPNPKSFSSPHTDNPLRRTKTGWEDFFWSSLERPAPYRDSLVVSNLGRIERLPPGCSGMRWTQSAAPFISPLCLQVVGHEAGLEICAAFREGCAVSREEVRGILKRFEEIIADLIEEDND